MDILSKKLKPYFWLALSLWTACIVGSLAWNVYEQHENILQIARNSAALTFEHDVLYRKWAAGLGGVYAPSKAVSPNPYLDVPNRDVRTTGGLDLTLVNPAYMARQVNQLAAEGHGVHGHITSLRPIRPENRPDPWEEKALHAFEKGTHEVSSVEDMKDGRYLRLMRPFIADKACLKCHARQGYREGQIRGGISISIPLAPLQAIQQPLIGRIALLHAILWLIGIGGIFVAKRGITGQIVAREGAEEVLRQERDYMSGLIETAGDAIVSVDRAGVVMLWNPAAEQIFGHGRAEAVGGTLLELVVPNRLRERFADLLAGPSCKGEEILLLRKDGREFPAELSFSSYERPGEHPEKILIFRDVTERKAAETAILRAKREWERTFDAVPDLIGILDNNHRIVRVNRAMAERFGSSPDRCIGEACYKTIHGLDAPPAFCPHCRTIDDGREHVTEVHDKSLGGYFLVSTTPLTDEDGKQIASVHVARDITALKTAEAALRERTLQIEAANRELESFSYSVSHDLRAPLRAIGGYSRIIMKKHGDGLNEEILEKFRVIESSTRKMEQLIEDLLAFSRLGRAQLSSSALDMERLVADAWEDLAPHYPGRKLEFHAGPTFRAMGDLSLIRQVVGNLLANALKFTKERPVTVIETGSFIEDTEVVFFIRDNGTGFDMRYCDKLFHVFQRLHSEEDFEGTGIGLSIVKRIIERHGGRVWAEGKVGEGAAFYFTLPVAKA